MTEPAEPQQPQTPEIGELWECTLRDHGVLTYYTSSEKVVEDIKQRMSEPERSWSLVGRVFPPEPRYIDALAHLIVHADPEHDEDAIEAATDLLTILEGEGS